MKAANVEIPPIAFAFLRFGSAALLLLVFLRWREGSIAVPWPALRRILLFGGIGFGVYQILWPTALQTIPAGDSAFIIAATPVLTALFAVRAGTDTLTARKLIGALISFVGVGIVVAGGPGLNLAASLVGDLLTLAAAVCWAIYTSFGPAAMASWSPLRTTAWGMVGGTIVLAPIGLWQAASVDWSSVSSAAWLGFAYSTVLAAGVANVIVFHAIRLLGPTRITALQFLVPFIAVLLGAFFLHEPVTVAQLGGGAVIIGGVAIARSFASGVMSGLAERIRALWAS